MTGSEGIGSMNDFKVVMTTLHENTKHNFYVLGQCPIGVFIFVHTIA